MLKFKPQISAEERSGLLRETGREREENKFHNVLFLFLISHKTSTMALWLEKCSNYHNKGNQSAQDCGTSSLTSVWTAYKVKKKPFISLADTYISVQKKRCTVCLCLVCMVFCQTLSKMKTASN